MFISCTEYSDGMQSSKRTGCLISVRNNKLITKVRERTKEDHCATLRMLADEFSVNQERICHTLVDDVGKKKVASRFCLILCPMIKDMTQETSLKWLRETW